MSKIDLFINLELKDDNCDLTRKKINIVSGDSGDTKRETVELAATASSTIFSDVAVDKFIYVESDSDFQININSLGFVDVKRIAAGIDFKEAVFLSKQNVTSIEIKNNSATDTIKISYILA